MGTLLTWNGIPPQIVGSLTELQRWEVIDDMPRVPNIRQDHRNWRDCGISVLKPIERVTTNIANRFKAWGAEVEDGSFLGFVSTSLQPGGTNFEGDKNLHSDRRRAFTDIYEHNHLVIRILCVSSAPADFVDLTAYENMGVILDRHRINNSRVYRADLLSQGPIIKPLPWQFIVFDASTPHNPEGVAKAEQRILQQAWLEMKLPRGWQQRIKRGDAPRFG